MMKATARAHTNIALVKYWGKKDPTLMLPQTDSLSLTLDRFYTTTSIEFDPTLADDQIQIDQAPAAPKVAQRVSQFLDLVRPQGCFARVASVNNVPMAAGLASSASAFAALAAAASWAQGLHPSRTELSRLARRGSGSATRSIFGGLVEWHAGHDDQSSFAEPIQEHVDFGLEMLAILLDTRQKKIGSRRGMQHVVATSPYYPTWREVVAHDMASMKLAIAAQDIDQIGHLAQTNALRMHALNLAADPGFTYFNAATLKAMETIDHLRETGVSCYYTMDAGPNVKVIYDRRDRETILTALTPQFGADHLVVAKPGPGVEELTDERDSLI